VSVMNTWSQPPLAQVDDGKDRARRLKGTPLPADRPAGKTTVLDGTGQFVGERPVGSIRPAAQQPLEAVTATCP
jgi:hypothetical protein